MILPWIANFFSLVGAYEGSKPHPKIRAFKMNVCYAIGNILGLIYFSLTAQWAFILLYAIYLVIAIKGVIHNGKHRKRITYL